MLDPPGKKYIIDATEPFSRIPDDAFPEQINLDSERITNAPDGWLLRTVVIGYLDIPEEEGLKPSVSFRYGELDSYAELDFHPGYEGQTVDLDWDPTNGWNVETAHDDGKSSFAELDWDGLGEFEAFDEALSCAYSYMESFDQ